MEKQCEKKEQASENQNLPNDSNLEVSMEFEVDQGK